MHETGSNTALIRILLIVLILVVPQIIRAMQRAKKAKSVAEDAGPVRTNSLGDVLREAMRKSAEQARARRGELPMQAEPLRLNEQFEQPPKIEPESSFLPSMLLLALVACLCLMAYRYWAG